MEAMHMAQESRRVLPKEPIVPSHADIGVVEKSLVSFLQPLLGFGFAGFVVAAIIVNTRGFSDAQGMPLLVGLEVVAVGVTWAVYLKRKSRAEESYQERIGQALARLKAKRVEECLREAQGLSQKVGNLDKSYSEVLLSLSVYLGKANNFLREAATEYEEEAFAPFWDKIEMATMELTQFSRSVTKLAEVAREYDESLAGRTHNFSVLTGSGQEVPDPSATLHELARLVRLGQRSFQFATIWEHRRTREVLVEGFATLGDAVNNLEYSIHSSLADLKTTLSSGVDSMIQEQKLMRERFEEAARKWDEAQSEGA
jgi:hypothetical protein